MSDIPSVISVVDVINIYQIQYSQVDKLWGYFSVVSLAVAGFVIGSDKSTKTIKETLAVTLAYICFCLGNSAALEKGQQLLCKLETAVITASKDTVLEMDTLEVFSVEYVFWFQFFVSLFVSVGILSIAWLRRKAT